MVNLVLVEVVSKDVQAMRNFGESIGVNPSVERCLEKKI